MKCKVFSKDLDLKNPNPPTIEKTIEFFGAETIETIEKTIEKKVWGQSSSPYSFHSHQCFSKFGGISIKKNKYRKTL